MARWTYWRLPCAARLPDPDPQDPTTGKDPGKIILTIETALGGYLGGYPHLDDIPRPADYVATFKPLYRDVNKLINTLCQLHGYYKKQLELKGVVSHKIAQELASLLDAANAVVKDFENHPSKGARKENALIATVRQLRSIFRDHYAGPRDSRRTQGAVKYLADWEKRELEFVKVALRDANIVAEGYKGLPRLFRDPRSLPPEEKGER